MNNVNNKNMNDINSVKREKYAQITISDTILIELVSTQFVFLEIISVLFAQFFTFSINKIQSVHDSS